MALHVDLVKGLSNITKLKGTCYHQLMDDLSLAEMSLKQINYLKVFYEHEAVTTSQLADLLNLSKPTVTEMVKKFIKLGCVVKQSCPSDGRVYYLQLTQKGENIATLDYKTSVYLATMIEAKLTQEELLILITLLKKLG